MKQIVINYLEHIESTVIQQLGMATAGGHHADAAQTHDAVHSDAIALVRVVRTNLLAELETEGAAGKADLAKVRDALRHLIQSAESFPDTGSKALFRGGMIELGWKVMAELDSVDLGLPASAAVAKQRMETAVERLQPEPGPAPTVPPASYAPAMFYPAAGVDLGAGADRSAVTLTLTVEQACELRGLLRRARSWVDNVPGLDSHTRIEGNELSASLQAAADEVDSAIESVSPTTPAE